MFDYKYLSENHLKGLSKYKYSAIDTSPLSNYVMHPTWNALVKFIPKCIAPNLLTFAGFVCMLVVVTLLSWFDYSLHAMDGPGYRIPRWCFTACGALVFAAYHLGRLRYLLTFAGFVCMLVVVSLLSWFEYSLHAMDGPGYRIPGSVHTVCGVVVFVAYHLDGLDGKQARRLGVSGPLGELFDHGLDSNIVFLIPFSVLSIFGREPEFSLSCLRGFLILISIVLNFYISHFEKYNTGTLYLPWGYDVSMWVSSFLFIIPGVYGPEVYKTYMIGGLSFARFFEVIVHAVGLTTTAPVVFYNIYISYKNRTGQMLSFLEAIRPLYSIVAATATFVYWAVHSKNDIIEYDPRAFIFLYGIFFSNIASRLIIAEMTHQRCESMNSLYWPLLAGVITSLALPQVEVPIMYTLVLGALSAHVHYGVCVVRQICGHLKISCFTVPKDKRK